MNPHYRNRLKNGVGEKDFYISKNSDVLVLPQSFCLPDEMLNAKQKDRPLCILYGPEVFTLKADENGIPVLKDISEMICDVPRTIGSYKKGQVSTITVKGFMLCIDKKLRDEINASSDKEYKKQAMLQISKIVKEFVKLNERNPLQNAFHELKHFDNDMNFQEIVAADGGVKLPPEQFAITRIADECSAFAKELLFLTQDFQENGKLSTFPDEFSSFKLELQSLSPQKQSELLNNPAKLVNKAVEMWLNNPRNESYMGEKGDFVSQLNAYAETADPNIIDENNTQFSKIIKAYFTFNFKGEEIDLSSEILNKIKAPKHLYADAEATLQKRKNPNTNFVRQNQQSQR